MMRYTLPTTPCVYEIRNSVNGRHYIGSSINARQRKNRHFRDLRRGVHRSVFLQRDYDKCGESNFEFKIIEAVDRGALLVREQFWIDSTHPVYNNAKVAGNTLGVKHRPDVVEANRARAIGFGNGNARITPEMASQLVELRDTATTSELAQRFGVHRSTIERVLKRVGAEKMGRRYVSQHTRSALREHALSTLLPSRRKPVVELSDDGAVARVFPSLTDAAHAVGVTTSTIYGAIRYGHRCRGSRWAMRDSTTEGST